MCDKIHSRKAYRGAFRGALRKTTPRKQALNNRAHPSDREKCVLVVGPESDTRVKIKQARHMLRHRRAIILSQKPFIIQEYLENPSLIVERVFNSNFVCRQLREHREEVISQVSKAKTGKPRRAYSESIKQGRYVRLPYGFGRDPGCAEKE